MIAARLVAAPTRLEARKFARQDFGALEILNVHKTSRRRWSGGPFLWRVSYVAPCVHCGGAHVDDNQCELLERRDLARELEPRGAILL